MLYNLRHFQFIYSKKRLGLQCRVTFNQGTRRRFGTWGLGGGGGVVGWDLEICAYLWKNPGNVSAR